MNSKEKFITFRTKRKVNFIIFMGCVVALLVIPLFVFAGEKEELQWKARALIAEANLFQSKVGDAQKAIQEFIKEIDTKGYMVNQEGNVVEKPKAQTPPPPIPPVVPKVEKK